MFNHSQHSPTVVLVHGAFADASGFGGVIRELQTEGHTVVAPANPLRGLSVDADYLKAFVGAIDGPVTLVGHSYGGAVITEAADELENVTGLVYIAAFGLEVGESCISVQEPFPAVLSSTNARPTAYPAGAGAGDGPEFYLDRKLFHETFCADVPVDVADVMAATQRPLALSAFAGTCTSAGWKSKPTWYLVSNMDQAIHPDTERFMADRMGATTETISGSHAAFVARPVAVADFIKKAVHQFV
jgi:pimeloyl-ACP methyl ester carboxylesterase